MAAGDKVMVNHPAACGAIAGHVPAAATAATVTLADPGDGFSWCVGQVGWSYDTAPTGGKLTITDGATAQTFYITAAGPGFIPFVPPIQFADSTAVSITLASGAGSVSGTLSGISAWKQKAGGV